MRPRFSSRLLQIKARRVEGRHRVVLGPGPLALRLSHVLVLEGDVRRRHHDFVARDRQRFQVSAVDARVVGRRRSVPALRVAPRPFRRQIAAMRVVGPPGRVVGARRRPKAFIFVAARCRSEGRAVVFDVARRRRHVHARAGHALVPPEAVCGSFPLLCRLDEVAGFPLDLLGRRRRLRHPAEARRRRLAQVPRREGRPRRPAAEAARAPARHRAAPVDQRRHGLVGARRRIRRGRDPASNSRGPEPQIGADGRDGDGRRELRRDRGHGPAAPRRALAAPRRRRRRLVPYQLAAADAQLVDCGGRGHGYGHGHGRCVACLRDGAASLCGLGV